MSGPPPDGGVTKSRTAGTQIPAFFILRQINTACEKCVNIAVTEKEIDHADL